MYFAVRACAYRARSGLSLELLLLAGPAKGFRWLSERRKILKKTTKHPITANNIGQFPNLTHKVRFSCKETAAATRADP